MSEAVIAAAPPLDLEPVQRAQRLAWIVIGALALNVVLDVVGFVADRSYHGEVQKLASGQLGSLDSAQTAENRVHLIGWLSIGLYIATAILFVIWFRRAYLNVSRMGVHGQRWSSAYSIGAWFLPFANLVRPKQIANDTWRGSDPDLPPNSGLGLIDPPIIFTVWWALWILGFIAGRVAFSKSRSADTLAALASAANWLTFSDITDALAAVAAIAVVYLLSARQTERARALTGGAP